MVLLDANILLEALISGRPRQSEVLDWLEKNREDFCISMLSVHLVLHFGLKDGLSITQLKEFLSDYPKIAMLPEDYVSAVHILKDKDHEDALQMAMAERTGCSHIVTLDTKFASLYSHRIKFINPLHT